MQTIKTPYALAENGDLVHISEAEKTSKYFCPICHDQLVLRKGDIRAHHFSHQANNNCRQETVTHVLAKLVLKKKLDDWINYKSPSPLIKRHCYFCQSHVSQLLPRKIDQVELEVVLKEGYVIDIGLLQSGKVIAAIEIKVTHPVGVNKSRNLPIPFVEVDGEKILDNLKSIDLITDKFLPITCKDCQKKFQDYMAKVKEISEFTGVKIPSEYYRIGIEKCWYCEAEILVFAWPGHHPHNKNIPMYKPFPKTIRYRSTRKKSFSYWANVCPVCDKVQGDFHLYEEPKGPFYKFECGKDDSKDFLNDMKKLAYMYWGNSK